MFKIYSIDTRHTQLRCVTIAFTIQLALPIGSKDSNILKIYSFDNQSTKVSVDSRLTF